jgi:hypothetical protein
MRRLRATLLLCVVSSLAIPSTAHAWWHYFDEMSGPGPFNGVEGDVRVVCWSKPVAPRKVDETLDRERKKIAAIVGILTPCLFGKTPKGFGAVPLENQRTASFNIDVSYNYAKHSHLNYADGAGHHIHAFAIRPTVWRRVARPIDVGAGVGLYRFRGNGFQSFHRVSIEPLIDIKPIALYNLARRSHPESETTFPDSQLDLVITVRLGLVYFPQHFNALDFGALPGTFDKPHETLKTISIYFDWDPIARRLRRPCNCSARP